jgi:hypothetical protein
MKRPQKNKILGKEWAYVHPFAHTCASDAYYIKLVNRILDLVEAQPDDPAFSPALRREIALAVTAYFEDVV